MAGQLGTSDSGQVCTGSCCCEVDDVRAQILPGYRQACSAQCFSCVAVPGMNLMEVMQHKSFDDPLAQRGVS